MNNDNSLVCQISFQLLVITIALAAFLPALVYTYSYNLLKEVKNVTAQSKNNMISFVLSLDFILTQSMFLVLVSGLAGVTIFISAGYQSKQGIITTGILLIVWYFLYFWITIGYSNCKMKQDKEYLNKQWPAWKKYRLIWLFVVLAHILSSIIFSILYICNWPSTNRSLWLAWILGTSSWWLIFAATIWIVPLIQYSPLMHIMESTMKKPKNIKSKSKKK